jgi:hypothetical protein
VENYVADYGYLYDWNTTMRNSTTAGVEGACPEGWHVPTSTEFQYIPTEPTDQYVSLFSNELAGYYVGSVMPSYNYLDEKVKFWTSTGSSNQAMSLLYESTGNQTGNHSSGWDVYPVEDDGPMYYSVRCVKNE